MALSRDVVHTVPTYVCTLRGTCIGSYVKNIVDNYVYIHTYFDVGYEYMDTFIEIVQGRMQLVNNS